MSQTPETGQPARKRRWFRFSLGTLVIFVLLAASGMGLWWRWESWVLEGALVGHNDDVVRAAFSPDSRRVVTASHDSTARIWDGEAGGELAVLKGHGAAVNCAGFSPDGHRVGRERATGRLCKAAC
jgi:WD40 repeat protein